jgi:hypothetical protein
MHASLSFSDEEYEQLMDALRGWEYKALLSEFYNEMRRHYKYGEDGELASRAEWAVATLTRLANDRNLEIL